MNRFVRAVALVGCVLLVWGAVLQPAHAQIPNYGLDPSRRPPVSPYINLLRTGASPGVSYYGIVRPEFAYSAALGQLQGQQTILANQQQELTAATALPATGHKSGFMTQSKYFMTSGGQSQATTFSRSVATPPPAAAARSR
jgi:hypothetical protein